MDIYQLIDHIHMQKIENIDEEVESALFTDDHEALFQLGVTLNQYGLIPQGIKVFERMMELYPEEIDVLSYYVEALIDNDEIDKAITILHNAPLSVEKLLLEADLYQQQHMNEVALEKLKEADDLAPDEPVIKFALAELNYFEGEYLVAARQYEQLLAEGIETFTNVTIPLRIADCMLQSGDYESAAEQYASVEESMFTSEDYFRQAISLQKTDRVDRAIQVLQTLLEKDPDFMQAYLLLVNLLESERKYEDAVLVGQKGIQLNEFYKELLTDTGRIMLKLRRDEVANMLVQALTIDPDYTEAGLLLADYYRNEEDYESLIKVFSLINEEDIDPVLMWHLAYSYQQEERDKEAKHFYEEAYPVLKDNGDFLKDYYQFTRETGDTVTGEQLYAIIRQLDPEFTGYDD